MYSVLGTAESRVSVTVPVTDFKEIRSSSGHVERRPSIRTQLTVGEISYDIDLTLTDRSQMKFPMLLGRSAIAGHFVVDPSKAYVLGKNK